MNRPHLPSLLGVFALPDVESEYVTLLARRDLRRAGRFSSSHGELLPRGLVTG